jgi:hypothetical protein
LNHFLPLIEYLFILKVLPFSQNEKCGWNRRACMSLENALKNERLTTGKISLKVTVADNNQVKWPMMFIYISTETIPVCKRFNQ